MSKEEDDKLLAELRQAQQEADQKSIADAVAKSQKAVRDALDEKQKKEGK